MHSYTYDAENRIVSVDGGATATYAYDAAGRRVIRWERPCLRHGEGETYHPRSGCCTATLVAVGEPEANQRLMEFPGLAVNLRALLVNVLKTKRS